MVDRITKNLRKLSSKEQVTVKQLVRRIIKGDLAELDVKKLKGRKDTYRIRKGQIRIIFRKTDTEPYIVDIERRSDQTY